MRLRVPRLNLIHRLTTDQILGGLPDECFSPWFEDMNAFVDPRSNPDLVQERPTHVSNWRFKWSTGQSVILQTFGMETIKEMHINYLKEYSQGHGSDYQRVFQEHLLIFFDKLEAHPSFKPEMYLMFQLTPTGNGYLLFDYPDRISANRDLSRQCDESISAFIAKFNNYEHCYSADLLTSWVFFGTHVFAPIYFTIRCAYGDQDQFKTRNGEGLRPREALDLLNSDPDITIVKPTNYGASLNNSFWFVKIISSKVVKSSLYKVFVYSANAHDLLGSKFVKHTKELTAPFYGVELELKTDYTPQEMIDAYSGDPFFILKNDGSITGTKRYAYELVTQPMTITAHKLQWAETFANWDYDKFDRSNNTSNGMHIHIDRKVFDDNSKTSKNPKLADQFKIRIDTPPEHLKRFCYFFLNPCNYNFIVAVSERNNVANTFSPGGFAVIPTHRITACTNKRELYNNAYDYWRSERGTVNVGTNKPTVEIRMFKGLVSFPTIVKNLEFTDSMVAFTRVTHRNNLTLKAYSNWLNTLPPNKYKTLREFYKRIKFDALVQEANVLEFTLNKGYTEKACFDQLNQLVSNARDFDPMMVKKINASLQRIIGKITFVFNKKTRKFEYHVKDRAKLTDLDTILESKFFRKKNPAAPPATVTTVASSPSTDPDDYEEADEYDYDIGPTETDEDDEVPY